MTQYHSARGAAARRLPFSDSGMQSVHEHNHLFTRHVQARPERQLVKIVERGQPRREELAWTTRFAKPSMQWKPVWRESSLMPSPDRFLLREPNWERHRFSNYIVV
jgi:hypothetical protein